MRFGPERSEGPYRMASERHRIVIVKVIVKVTAFLCIYLFLKILLQPHPNFCDFRGLKTELSFSGG